MKYVGRLNYNMYIINDDVDNCPNIVPQSDSLGGSS